MPAIFQSILADVQRRGLQPVAKDLQVSRLALAGALLGCAQQGTVSLIEQRWQARPTAASEARP